MHPPAPFPFLSRKRADELWNLHGPGVTICEDDYADRMLDFWLRVQARGGRCWRMQPAVTWALGERFQFSCLRVDFESGVRMFVFYLFPLIHDVPMLTDGGEGRGLYVLELPLIAAHCRTVSECIAAIDAVASYTPTLIIRREELIARGFLRGHYTRARRLLLSNSAEPPDRVRLASLDRSMGRLAEEDEQEYRGGF
jgi:hypothetical protein